MSDNEHKKDSLKTPKKEKFHHCISVYFLQDVSRHVHPFHTAAQLIEVFPGPWGKTKLRSITKKKTWL